MKGKMIPAERLFAKWRKNPSFRAAYAALDEEFMLAGAMIEARAQAHMSQEEIAKRMQTSQPNVARLEGGKGNPSLNTLRKYARATGTRLKITFEPKGAH